MLYTVLYTHFGRRERAEFSSESGARIFADSLRGIVGLDLSLWQADQRLPV